VGIPPARFGVRQTNQDENKNRQTHCRGDDVAEHATLYSLYARFAIRKTLLPIIGETLHGHCAHPLYRGRPKALSTCRAARKPVPTAPCTVP